MIEALKYFKRRKESWTLDDYIQKYEEKAIEALKKQTPKKLTDAVFYPNKDYLAVASCPSCHYHILIYRNEFHCDKCGQAVYLNEVIK